jgi:hypothetical protein
VILKLYGIMKTNKSNYKVLTPNGYMSFEGIRKLHKPVLKFNTLNKQIRVTYDHPFVIEGETVLANTLKVGDVLELKNKKTELITDIQPDGYEDVYDLINVSNGNTYYANDIHVHNCFLQTGESAIDEAFFEKLKAECAEPTFVFDEGHYLLWREPDKERLYVVGVDVAEGVGEAASVVQVLDITDLRNIEQVAIYHNRNISPYNFTTKLHEILQHWGNPPALIERNNCGAQVVDQLKNNLRYENIVNYGSKAGDKIFNKPGVVAHTNTKYKGVTNMRYWINELNVVRIRDIKTLAELKGFVRYPNGTWAAKSGSDSHDDRVMSLIWTLMILENEVTEKYYEIVELDDNKRPQVIKSMDYGIKYFINPTSMYSNERDSDNAIPLPILISTGSEPDQTDLTDLQQQGWSYLN